MMTRGALARVHAARALFGVLDQGHNLTELLEGLDRKLGAARDRAQVRRRCNRVLRDWPALNWRVEQLLDKPLARKSRLAHFILASAIDELIEGREPAPAVVHATVAATREAGLPHLAGLTNAVLRNFQRRATELAQAMPDDPVLRWGYPGWMLDRIKADWPDDWQAVVEAGNRPPPVWLRTNRRRTTTEALQALFAENGIDSRREPGLADALKLDHPAAISELPGFSEGLFSIQDAGAQAAADLLDLQPGQRVLDACAAPGGKAAHILERADVELVAVELDPRRAGRIDESMARVGVQGEIVIGDASRPADWWDGRGFDRILVDAPCSATGVMRRHPDIRWLRRAADIDSLLALQDALLGALWPLLEPGGLLVYSTCSILAAENRERGQSFLETHTDAGIRDSGPPASRPMAPGHQILPGDLDRDGFYYLVLERLR